jgi:large subunit ribosomal protein L15
MDIQSFIDNGLASKNDLIKVLGDGEIKTAIKITAHKFSKSAKAQIEKSGGEAIII